MTADLISVPTSRSWASRIKVSWPMILLVALTFAVYMPAILHGVFHWDDLEYITENPLMTEFSGLSDIWLKPSMSPQYYPMTFTLFFIQHAIWGNVPQGYIAVNALLHAGCACVLFVLLKRLNIRAALPAAILFSVHPLAVESVAWVAETKNTLSMLFSLAAIVAYLRPDQNRETSPDNDPKQYVIATLLFIFALLSKSTACVIPAVLLVLIWWRNQKFPSKHIPWLVFWFLLALGDAILVSQREAAYFAEQQAPALSSLSDRILIVGRNWWFYVTKFLWPHPLSMVYSRWDINSQQIAAYLFPVSAALSLGLAWFYRRRIGFAPVMIGLLYTIAVLPLLGVVSCAYFRISYVADHFAYMAIAPLSVGAAMILSVVAKCLHARWANPAIVILIAGVFAGISFARCFAYTSTTGLWEDTLRKSPDNDTPWSMYAIRLIEQNRFIEARAAFQKAYELPPHDPQNAGRLANTYILLGDLDSAEKYAQEYINKAPKSDKAYLAMGLVKRAKKQPAEATQSFIQAHLINPGDGRAALFAGMELASMGIMDKAMDCYRAALQINPRSALAYNLMGRAIAASGNLRASLNYLKAACELDAKPEYRADLERALSLLSQEAATLPQKTK